MTSSIYIYNNVASGLNRLYDAVFIAVSVIVKQLNKFDATVDTRRSVIASAYNGLMDNVSLVAKKLRIWLIPGPLQATLNKWSTYLTLNSASYPQRYPEVKVDSSQATTNPRW